jgi:hypothetical protein
VPAIIDRETWEKVQRQIATNSAKNVRNRKAEYLLLARRLRCGYCGEPMGGYRDPRSRVRRYRCHSQKWRVQGSCRGSISADAVEAQAWRVIELLLLQPATIERLLEQRQEQATPQREGLQQSLTHVAAQLAKCADEGQRWERAYAEGVIDLTHFKRLCAELQERQTALERTRAELQEELTRVAEIDTEAARLRSAVAQSAIAPMATIPERRAILEALDVVVVCRYHEVPLQTRTFFSIELDPEQPGSRTWKGEPSLRSIDWTKMVPQGQPSVPVEDWDIFRNLLGTALRRRNG